MYHYEFIEGCFFLTASEPGIYIADAELRMWVLSELMWDRYQDGEALVREWMKGVYGYAWGPMMDYWKHVQKIAQIPNTRVTGHTDPLEYLSVDWLEEAEGIFQRAYALSMADSTAHRYVLKARLSLGYMQLLHALSSASSQTPLDKPEKEKYLNLLGKWVKEYKEFGYERISETQTIDEFAESFRATLEKK